MTRESLVEELESESIEIIREVVATAAKPVMLYSIGKDSSVMLRLAQKAFFPGPIPFPLMSSHVAVWALKVHETLSSSQIFCMLGTPGNCAPGWNPAELLAFFRRRLGKARDKTLAIH
jgi:hypothetical protein